MHWEYMGNGLQMFWKHIYECISHALEMYLKCIGIVLDSLWECIGDACVNTSGIHEDAQEYTGNPWKCMGIHENTPGIHANAKGIHGNA